jgi:hypothetical protein
MGWLILLVIIACILVPLSLRRTTQKISRTYIVTNRGLVERINHVRQ